MSSNHKCSPTPDTQRSRLVTISAAKAALTTKLSITTGPGFLLEWSSRAYQSESVRIAEAPPPSTGNRLGVAAPRRFAFQGETCAQCFSPCASQPAEVLAVSHRAEPMEAIRWVMVWVRFPDLARGALWGRVAGADGGGHLEEAAVGVGRGERALAVAVLDFRVQVDG